MWVDRHGRAVSPPDSSPSFDFSLDHPSLKRTASYRQGKETKCFRKVMVIRQPGLSLGLRIRGGAERGLGIFISAVEETSAAEYAGLQVGDQILSVNDRDFTDITKQEAWDIMERSSRMSMVVRSLGKMPRSPIPNLPPLYISSSESASGPSTAWLNEVVQSAPPIPHRPSLTRKRSSRKKKPDEKPPAVSVPDRSLGGYARLERKSCKYLNESQRSALSYYCKDYELGNMGLEPFLNVLFKLLDTPEKYKLMSEVRNFIRHEDLEEFDELLYKRELHSKKSNDAMKLSVEVHADASDSLSHSPMENVKGPSPRSSMRASIRRRQHPSHPPPPSQQDVHRLKVPVSDRNPDTGSDDSGVEMPNGSYYAAINSRKNSRVSTTSRDSILEHLQAKNPWRTTHRGAPRRSLDAAMRENSEAGTQLRRKTLRRHSSGGEGVNPEERRSSYKTFEDRRWSTGGEVPDTPIAEMENNSYHLDAAQAILSRLEAIALSRRHSHQLPKPPRLSPAPPPPLTPNGLQVPHIRVRRHRSLPDPVAIQARKRAQQLEQHQQHRTASVRIPGHHTIHEGEGRFRVFVKKTRPILGIAIEGGRDTPQYMPRIISIHSSGSAFDAGGLKVGHVILEVDGLRTNGLAHNEVAQLIAHAFYNIDREQVEFLVTETAKTTEAEIRRASLFVE